MNFFRRVAVTIAKWTGMQRPQDAENDSALIEPVSAMPAPAITPQAIDEVLELPPLEDGEIITIEAESPADPASDAATVISDDLTALATSCTVDAPEMEAFGRGETLPDNVSCTPVVPVATVVDLKGDPAPSRRNQSVEELCDLIEGEVRRCHDTTVEIYERLLGSAQQEAQRGRRTIRTTLSIGAGLALTAALVAMWSVGQVNRLRGEAAGLHGQLTSARSAVKERDQLRGELARAKEVASKAEVDSLKLRLDQAVTMLSQRPSGEIAARPIDDDPAPRLIKSPSTQPVSTAGDKSATLGSERQDAWSVLLNGKE